MKPIVLTLLKNLALLAFVALPLFFVLVWIGAWIRGTEGSRDLGYALETGGVYYLTNVVPVLVGGLIHQLIWLVLPRGWPSVRRRIVALVLVPLIPIAVWLSWGGPAGSLLYFAIPIVLALAVYVLLMRDRAASEPAPV